jgi:hypothetical protein
MQEIDRFWTTADAGERVQLVECRDAAGAVHYQAADGSPVTYVQPGLFADAIGNRLVADDAARHPGRDPLDVAADFAKLGMRA